MAHLHKPQPDLDRRVYKRQTTQVASGSDVYTKSKHCEELPKMPILLQDSMWPT